MKPTREDKWKLTLAEKKRATRLVRDILGCSCPPGVFDHYQVQKGIFGTLPAVQLVMGDRLLLRIVDMDRLKRPGKTIRRLLVDGLKERESRGLNRFRLVVVGKPSPDLRKELMKLPEDGMDSRVHLHFISEI